MKRFGFLYDKICTIDNINLADNKARKNKRKRYAIIKHDENKDEENTELLNILKQNKFITSKYKTFTIYEPKERLIYKLPYYPDRIVLHAIINILEPIWVNTFISNTYSCIKGRGIHKLVCDLKNTLTKYRDSTEYCLKLDIKKFYPSIDHDILYEIILKKIKDKLLLNLLKDIIYSAPGVPIGNYLSQFFANLYLTYFDHWIKEELHCKYYFRYADDIIILHKDKHFLKNILVSIKVYLKYILKLDIKSNYLIYLVSDRGIDFVGYKFYHSHTLLRKSIKRRIFRTIRKYLNSTNNKLYKHLSPYFGWLKYSNSKNLLHKILSITNIHFSNWIGKHININDLLNKNIRVISYNKFSNKIAIHFIHNNNKYYTNTKNIYITNQIINNNLPIILKIQ